MCSYLGNAMCVFRVCRTASLCTTHRRPRCPQVCHMPPSSTPQETGTPVCQRILQSITHTHTTGHSTYYNPYCGTDCCARCTYRTRPADPPAPRWPGRSRPASRRRSCICWLRAGSLAKEGEGGRETFGHRTFSNQNMRDAMVEEEEGSRRVDTLKVFMHVNIQRPQQQKTRRRGCHLHNPSGL